MADIIKKRVYQEGCYGFKVFPLIENAGVISYGTGVEIKGTQNIDITFSSTRTKTAADDEVDYLNRTSPLTGKGTITLIGLSKDDYKALYASNIVDDNDVIVGGRANQTKRLGVIFYNTETYVDENGLSQSTEDMFVLPNVTFELPNITLQTIAEDDTTIRPIELTVNAQSLKISGGDRYTYAIVNKADVDGKIGAGTYEASVKGNVYKPNTELTAPNGL